MFGIFDVSFWQWSLNNLHVLSFELLNLHLAFIIFYFSDQKSKTPVVTTAEVSSDESTKAESPEQPQAITMATQPKASLSTVHVQQSFHGIRTSIPVLTHSASEVINCLLLTEINNLFLREKSSKQIAVMHD